MEPGLHSGCAEAKERREDFSWFAVQTRSRHEKKVSAELSRRGVTTFLPLLNQRRRWSDRYQEIAVPLFPCYSFVRLAPSSKELHSVMRIRGVVGLVGNQGCGTAIPDKEIEQVRRLLDDEGSCAIHPFLRAGQRVRILNGSLAGFEGILVTQDRDQSLVISIELIQRSLAVQISGYDLELL
jgi:transcription antitermination factor NusG